MSILRLDGVSKSYGHVAALRETSLSISEGAFVSLLGPSGSGKSTLLNLIAGVAAPTTGRITIAGRDVTNLPASRRGLGMVFQNYALMPHMTVFRNVAFPLEIRRMSKGLVREKVMAVLDLVQLAEAAQRKPRELSGGQQQRVALARCLVYNPPIILMDEPLGALDKRLREQLQLELARLHKSLGITILFVTHDQEEALTLSDHIVLMNKGGIVQQGSPGELYQRPEGVFAASFLGDANLLPVDVVAAGAHVRLQLPGGGTLVASGKDGPPPEPRSWAFIRPENLVLSGAPDPAASDNRLCGVLERSLLLGSVVKHHVTVGGARLVATALFRPGTSLPDPGGSVWLSYDPSDVKLLPEEPPP